MASRPMDKSTPDGFDDAILAMATESGSAGHLYASGEAFLRGRHAMRNLADAIHHFGYLHGRHPGMIANARAHTAATEAKDWFAAAIDGFAKERAYLARLVVAVGPSPSTPGQAESEAALSSQYHALEMLSQSDRTGCAFGAAVALVLDWTTIRTTLDQAAERFGIIPPNCDLPMQDETLATLRAVATTPSIERAAAFGAQQLFVQHRGLWDLLEARHIARGDY